MDGKAREEHTASPRDGQFGGVCLVDSVDLKCINSLRPFTTVPITHRVIHFPTCVFRVCARMGWLEFACVTSRYDAEPAVSRIGIAHRNPACHERIGFGGQIMGVLMKCHADIPEFLAFRCRVFTHVHRLHDTGRAPQELLRYAGSIGVRGDVRPLGVDSMGENPQSLLYRLGHLLVFDKGRDFRFREQVGHHQIAVTMVVCDVFVR